MSLENFGDNISPGGFTLGDDGRCFGSDYRYAPSVPKSITFYLDNTAMVADQYGRPMRGVITAEGKTVLFADRPPDGDREGVVIPRSQFSPHAQVVAALTAEGFDWLAYEVRYVANDGRQRTSPNLTLEKANELMEKMASSGTQKVGVFRMIACAGFPQLPYDLLKKLPELPPTPYEELRKIRDSKLRQDALKARRERDEQREKELQATEAE